MRGVAVLQARTGSSRLPGKALLPVGGLPMAVLAARRAANAGHLVIVATSEDAEDDRLAELLADHDVACFRGSLNDVLGRVVGALRHFDDEQIVFRLTADNVFPDGSLLDEVEQEFTRRGVAYLACNGIPSGVPYGVSVEATRLRYLREADASALPGSDREHVTPHVIRRFGARRFERYAGLGRGLDRCTVDSLSDYLRVSRVFRRDDDSTRVPWLELVRRLASAPGAPIVTEPVDRLVVGGAQLGMAYGITRSGPVPAPAECEAIIRTAVANGASWIDTARGYGRSEENIGAALSRGLGGQVKVVTKLATLDDVDGAAGSNLVTARVDASVYRSCTELRTRAIDALLLHRAAHLDAWSGAAWRRLLELRAQGVVRALGVSVQSPDELARALQEPEVSLVQMPFNILDHRWRASFVALERARKERGLLVHVRSALLQGLLSGASARLWRRAHVADVGPLLDWLGQTAQRFGRRDVVDLCLAFVRSQSWVDGVVVGMEGRDQLVDNIVRFATPMLAEEVVREIEASAPRLDERTLDPARWAGETA